MLVTQESTRLFSRVSTFIVEGDSHLHHPMASVRARDLLGIGEPTQGRNPMTALSAGKASLRAQPLSYIRESTQERHPIDVLSVGKATRRQREPSQRDTKVLRAAYEDVFPRNRCLPVTDIRQLEEDAEPMVHAM
uniref:Uncharacterized protein n=1 Tax=Chrysemys picta bellii TaxID=8478 RepID=A0A8C3F1A0_CHRPI